MARIGNSDNYAARPARPPVSRHPAFPAIVALWFAVLLGLGSLVLPAPVVERAIFASRIARLVPGAAAPPGMIARALIALAAAAIGALTGLALARRVAHSWEPAPRGHREQDSDRRPISAHDELDEENLASASKGRRRPLTVAGSNGTDDLLEVPPLPGRDPRLHIDHHAHEGESDEPLDLLELQETELVEPDTPAAERQVFEATPPDSPLPEEEVPGEPPPEEVQQAAEPAPDGLETAAEEAPSAPAPFSLPFEQLHDPASPDPVDWPAPEAVAASEAPGDEPVPAGEDATVTAANEAREDISTAPLEELGLVQLAERLGNSIGQLRANRAAHASPAEVAAPVSPGTMPGRINAAETEDAVEGLAGFFADSAGPEAQPAPSPAPEPELEPAIQEQQVSVPVEAQDAVPEADDSAVPDGSLPGPPASFMPFDGLDEDEDEDDDDAALDELAASFSLPLGNWTGAVSPAVSYTAAQPAAANGVPIDPADRPADNDGEDTGETESESIASLLGAHSPFHDSPADAMRNEDNPDFAPDDDAGPAETFPAASEGDAAALPETPAAKPANVAENEKALREALLNLQRVNSCY